MSRQDELVERGKRLLLNNYRQAPVVMARGEGCVLFDVEGRRYLDMAAGVAVAMLGHGHGGLADAIGAQARRLLHVSNLYFIEAQLDFAEALSRRAFHGRAFFCNSGTEANEAALKLARRYQAVAKKQPQRVELIAFENSFHGRTFGVAQRHRPGQVPRRLRAAGRPGPLLPLRRSGRRARAAVTKRHLRRDRRADPGRGGHQPAAARLLARPAAHLHRDRHRADLRRGADRRLPDRHLLRLRERGRGPRRRHAGQGAGGRHPHRRHAGQ